MSDTHSVFLRHFARVEPVLRRYVYAQIPDTHTAEDALQDIAVVLWKKYGEFEEGKSFQRWSFGVARYVILHVRRDAARNRYVFPEDVDRVFVTQLEKMAPDMDERKSLLRKCLEKLSDRQRKVIWMKYEDGTSCREISRSMNTTVVGIRSLLFRVRQALVECIESGMQASEEVVP